MPFWKSNEMFFGTAWASRNKKGSFSSSTAASSSLRSFFSAGSIAVASGSDLGVTRIRVLSAAACGTGGRPTGSVAIVGTDGAGPSTLPKFSPQATATTTQIVMPSNPTPPSAPKDNKSSQTASAAAFAEFARIGLAIMCADRSERRGLWRRGNRFAFVLG